MKRSIIICLLSATLLSSCAVKVIQPDVEIGDKYLFAEPDSSGVYVNVAWWEAFGDTTLNRLIDVALTNNRNLAAASSAIEQARYSLAVTRASFLPSFVAGLSGEGEYTISDETGKRKISQEYYIQPEVSWDISLFGALRSSTDAGRAQILSSEYSYRGVMLSLVAQVATTYFQWLEYARSMIISEQSYALRLEEQMRIDSMYHYGFSSAVDLEQARAMTATAAADIPQYRRAMIQTNLTLNTLLGESPSLLPDQERTPSRPADSLLCRGMVPNTLPDYVPSGLPSDLLERRPDVQKAYYDMQSAAAKVRYARAQRFPTVNLTASGGVLAYSVEALFKDNPFYWNAISQVTQPIFAFGAAKKNQELAYEVYRQSVYEYEQAVLDGLSDVETALVGIKTYRNQILDFIPVLTSNCRLQNMTYELYLNGMNSYLNVIDAERDLYNAQLQYVQLLTNQLTAYINLYSALGGGW